MTSVSAITSMSGLIPANVSETQASATANLPVNTSTPAAPGSGIMQYVDMFEASNAQTQTGSEKSALTEVMLSMLKLPVIPLDNGSDDDD